MLSVTPRHLAMRLAREIVGQVLGHCLSAKGRCDTVAPVGNAPRTAITHPRPQSLSTVVQNNTIY